MVGALSRDSLARSQAPRHHFADGEAGSSPKPIAMQARAINVPKAIELQYVIGWRFLWISKLACPVRSATITDQAKKAAIESDRSKPMRRQFLACRISRIS
jgi:hypothetical protein